MYVKNTEVLFKKFTGTIPLINLILLMQKNLASCMKIFACSLLRQILSTLDYLFCLKNLEVLFISLGYTSQPFIFTVHLDINIQFKYSTGCFACCYYDFMSHINVPKLIPHTFKICSNYGK